MKTLTRVSLIAAVAVSLANAVGADIKARIPELREQANLFLGPLPDKMPGSENDTPARIELGKKLYFEKKLSANDTQSCNSCHAVDRRQGGVDNEPTSEGAFGKRGDRNSPTTLNAGFHFSQFWDGRAKDLQEQAKGPILNPVEMAMPDEAAVIKKLEQDAEYVAMFKRAFPGTTDSFTYDNLGEAIAAFERTLITHDRFDDFQKGDDRALTNQELKGLDLFLNTGCLTCHMEPSMGGNTYQRVGLIHPYETSDKGRFVVTENDDDLKKFKVPSLRNIALTAPYFHNGKQADLKETVKLMAYIQLDQKISDADADALVAFLKTLTGKDRVR